MRSRSMEVGQGDTDTEEEGEESFLTLTTRSCISLEITAGAFIVWETPWPMTER